MFKAIASKFNNIFSGLGAAKIITEEHLEKAVREIKVALLEADVALDSVKEFTKSLAEKFKGETVLKSINPLQAIIKMTQDEITNILSQNHELLQLRSKGVNVILMVGLQGAGKTTTTGKLASKLSESGKKVLMTSLDVRRPAAQLQLKILGENISVTTLEIIEGENVLEITKRAMEKARREEFDVLILDTAGRNELEEDLMEELEKIKKMSDPIEILLVIDALQGRQSLNIATGFHERLKLTGVIITRMESDTRGGVAFNVKFSLKLPIKYYGSGEKMQDFEDFYPERIASRILDMGDVVSLVETAEKIINKKDAEAMQKKMEKGNFDFEDFLSQIRGLKKMGGFSKVMSFIPGASKFSGMMGSEKLEQIYKQEAIILSMTAKERKNPQMIANSHSRKYRIANGSGTRLSEVNKLLKQFEQMKKMLGKFNGMDKSMLENMKNPNDIMQMLK
jgi:signal recognition particle subunit SRP54